MAHQSSTDAASFPGLAMDDDFEKAESRFMSKYEKSEKLGEGTYGVVYKAKSTRTKEVFAIKVMKFTATDATEGVPSTAIREIALLKELNHRNVVRLLDVFCKPNKLVLVFEYLENDLKKYMKSQGGHLSSMTVKSLAYQLCCGLEFCHASRIIHRDLKPQNLLIDSSLRLKIADFGLARAFSLPVPVYTHEVITIWYRPPEILLGSSLYSIPVDLWGVGCVLAEMATGAPLFCGDSEIDTIFKIFQKLGTPTEETWPGITALQHFSVTFPRWSARGWANIRNTQAQVGPEGIDLLDKLLCYDPKKRLSARQALVHPYFGDVDMAGLGL